MITISQDSAKQALIQSLSDKFLLPKEGSHFSFNVDDSITPLNSKIYGVPFTNDEHSIPDDMVFMWQLNFSEIPPIEHFPTSGILQLWYKDNDSLSSTWDVSTDNDNIKFLYFKDTTLVPKDLPDSDIMFSILEDNIPNGLKISFSDSELLLPPCLSIPCELLREASEDILDDDEE